MNIFCLRIIESARLRAKIAKQIFCPRRKLSFLNNFLLIFPAANKLDLK